MKLEDCVGKKIKEISQGGNGGEVVVILDDGSKMTIFSDDIICGGGMEFGFIEVEFEEYRIVGCSTCDREFEAYVGRWPIFCPYCGEQQYSEAF